MPLVSFDVYDTVVTRAVGSPPSVFLLLGRYLTRQGCHLLSAEAFARARMTAEDRAYKTHGVARTTLQHIYDELAYAIGLSSNESQAIMAAECELEARLLRVIDDNRDRVAASRAQGATIAFLSDMYLPAEFFFRELHRHGLWTDTDRLYLSCDIGELKLTGGLFREFLGREGASPREVSFHRGNHGVADVLQAQRAGIHVEPFLEGNLNRYEQILEAHAWRTEGLSSLFAGASRLARLRVSASRDGEKIQRDVAAGVMGPVLTGFLLWVLRRAMALKVERLYFISRDGEILFQLAQRLAKKLSSPVELRYLYLSRQVINLCGMVQDDEALWSWLWDQSDFMSVEAVLARLFLEPAEIGSILQEGGFAEADWRRNLNPREREQLRALFAHKSVKQAIIRSAEERQDIVTRYLRQEGLFDDVSWCLVDLGWSGSMQNALAVVLANQGRPAPRAFYFGLVDRPNETEFGARECYLFDANRKLGFYAEVLDGWVQLLEAFCAGTHGTVIDLLDAKSTITPVLRETHNQAVLDWGLPVVQYTTCQFVDALELSPELVNPFVNVKEPLVEVLRAFWSKPRLEEVRVWGAFPWEDGLGRLVNINPLVKPFTASHVLNAVLQGFVKCHHRAAWRQGCLVLSPTYVRLALRALEPYLKLRSRNQQQILHVCWSKVENCEMRGQVLAGLLFRAIAYFVRPDRWRRTVAYLLRRPVPKACV